MELTLLFCFNVIDCLPDFSNFSSCHVIKDIVFSDTFTLVVKWSAASLRSLGVSVYSPQTPISAENSLNFDKRVVILSLFRKTKLGFRKHKFRLSQRQTPMLTKQTSILSTQTEKKY